MAEARDPFSALGATEVQPTQQDPFEALGATEVKEPDIQLRQAAPSHYQQRPDITPLGEAAAGFKKMTTPVEVGGYRIPAPFTPNFPLGAVQAVGGLTAPITNLVSRGAKALANQYENLPQPAPIQIPNQVDPKTGKLSYFNIKAPHPAEQIGGLSEIGGDIGAQAGLFKAAGLLKAPLARMLPTVSEKVSAIQKAAQEAQQTQATAAAARDAAIRPAREATELGAASDIGSIKGGLQAQQEQVGEQAARAAAPVPPKRTDFDTRYQALHNRAATTETEPVNLNAAAYGTKTEAGIAQMTPAERQAAHIQRVLTTGGPGGTAAVDLPAIEEDVRDTVRRSLAQGTVATKADYNAIVKSVVGPETRSMSGDALINTQKRLNAAEGAAYEAGHKNLARQFGELEAAVKKDIAAADPRVAAGLKAVDRDYFKQKATEWYTNGVQNSFDPKTGVWDRKRFVKWWENHADELNDNKYLKRMLGDKYEATQGLVNDMQKANEMNIEQQAKTAISNRKRELGGQLRDIAGKEQANAKLVKAQEDQMVKATKGAIEKATGKPFSESMFRWAGPLAVVHGLTGGSTKAIMTGLGLVIGHDKIIQVMNSMRGLSLMQRLIRSAPGTAQAGAAGAALTNFANTIQESPSTAEMATSTYDPGFAAWKAKYAPNDTGRDYDLRGAYEAGKKPGADSHFTDEFKLPNHPSFSVESKYWKPGMPAGRWEGEGPDAKYIPMDAPTAEKYVKDNPEVRPLSAREPEKPSPYPRSGAAKGRLLKKYFKPE